MAKILIVDDEENIIDLVKFTLEKEGHEILTAFNGNDVLPACLEFQPEIIILDLMLPGADGFQVCRKLRSNEKTLTISIIMLTAKTDEVDKIVGLELGADDYITKPFSPRELAARVKAQLRRSKYGIKKQEFGYNSIKVGDLTLIPESYQVFVNGKKLDLSLKEFELLKLFITNPGRVFKREYILERLWGYDYISDSRTVDVHVSYLRQKIEKDSHSPQYIETVRGVGYRLKVM